MFSISFRKYHDEEKEKQLRSSKCKFSLFAPSLRQQLVLVLYVFLSSYRNTVLNQSACIFALGYFLVYIIVWTKACWSTVYIVLFPVDCDTRKFFPAFRVTLLMPQVFSKPISAACFKCTTRLV